jgi:CheY-like chemotaxis protein
MDKAKILVVDDDPKLSRLVKLFLERTKLYDVVEENRSSHAVRTAREIEPVAILLDVDMPGKDGGEVAKELKADPVLRTKPVLFFTSLISVAEAGKHEVMRSGQAFLAKPVNPTALVEAVGRLVSKAAALAASA